MLNHPISVATNGVTPNLRKHTIAAAAVGFYASVLLSLSALAPSAAIAGPETATCNCTPMIVYPGADASCSCAGPRANIAPLKKQDFRGVCVLNGPGGTVEAATLQITRAEDPINCSEVRVLPQGSSDRLTVEKTCRNTAWFKRKGVEMRVLCKGSM